MFLARSLVFFLIVLNCFWLSNNAHVNGVKSLPTLSAVLYAPRIYAYADSEQTKQNFENRWMHEQMNP